MKINWRQKLTSRKFWDAFIGFITALLIAFGVDNLTIEQIAKDNPGGYGLYIAVYHGNFGSLSAHLSKFNCKVGQKVKAKDLIGYSGNTGMSTGPHLHFEIRDCVYSKFWEKDVDSKYKHAVDPQPLLNKITKTDREKVQEYFGFDNNTMFFR